MTNNTPPKPTRAALAQAISERDVAEINLLDARSAVQKSTDHLDTARHRLAELNQQLDIVEHASPDEIVSFLAKDDFDVALLEAHH